jgi:O-antigen/teichoic acid export membrane protein
VSAPTLAASTIPSRRLVITNTAALVGAYAAPRALTFAAAVVAARILGTSDFGVYTTAASVAVVASILASAGMQPLLIREIARAPDRASELIAAAHLSRLLTILLMASAIVLVPFVGFPPTVAIAAALLALGYAVGTFVDNLSAYFQGIEQMHVWTQASALLGLVTGVLGIALVAASRNLLWLCAAPVGGQLAALAWLLRRAPASLRWPPLPARGAVVRLLGQLAPFALTFGATTIYYRADILILAQVRSPAEVGLYGAAARFLDVTQALALAGAGAMLPHLSRSRAAPGSGSLRVLALFTAISLPAAATLFFLREPIVVTLYGHQYAASVPLVALLAPAIVGRAVNMFALAAFAGADLIRLAGLAYLAAAAVSVTLNLYAIPRFGASGAAGVALLTETALAGALAFVLWRRRGG